MTTLKSHLLLHHLSHLIDAERANPGSQDRLPNENVPLVWAQSLKIVGDLLIDGLITPAELDPLGRRLNVVNAAARSSSSGSGVNIASSSTSSSCSRTLASDVVVQVVLLAESADLQAKMAMYGLETQTLESCAPITISHPSALRDAYTALGENPKLVKGVAGGGGGVECIICSLTLTCFFPSPSSSSYPGSYW